MGFRAERLKATGKLISLSFIIFYLSFSRAAAQDDPEYRMEVGGGLGLMAYQGDLGGGLLKGM